MKLAVISDLHIGQAARAKELSPYTNDENLDEGFLEALETLAKQQKLACQYLLVPGDLTNTAHPLESRLAADVISKVAAAVGVQNEQIFAVPGNHDVSWSVPKAVLEALTEGHPPAKNGGSLATFADSSRYLSFSWKDSQFSEFTGKRWQSLLEDPYFSVMDSAAALIVAYNSAFSDGPNQKPHRGEAHQDHLSKIDAALKKLAHTEDGALKPRIFVVHHHVHQHTGPNYNWVDYSIMHNADGLQKLLAAHHFDLLVHGHKHFPRFATYSVDGNRPLAILGAGSFSRALDRLELEIIGNTFHVIDIERRDPGGSLQGSVLTWIYRHSHGWIPAQKERYAIAHRRPFGCAWDDSLLCQNLKKALQTSLSTKKTIRIDDLATSLLPDLKFADSERLEMAIDKEAASLGLHVEKGGDDPCSWLVIKG